MVDPGTVGELGIQEARRARRLGAPLKYLIVTSFLAFLVFPPGSGIFRQLWLPSSPPLGFRHAMGVVTHPFAIPGLPNWAWCVGLIWVSHRMMHSLLTPPRQAAVILIGASVGGVSFLLLESEGRPFAGLAFVAWAFLGASCAFGIVEWRRLHWGWRVYTGLMLVGLVNVALAWSSVEGAQALSAIAGGLAILMWRSTEGRAAQPQ